jgi:hypothetical protein
VIIPTIDLLLLAASSPDVDTFPHPALPTAASWPGVVVIVIVVGFFATAMVLGPVVRAIMGDQTGRDRKK